MKKKEIVALAIANFLILICFCLLLVNITQFPFRGENPIVQYLYFTAFLGVALDLIAVFKKKVSGSVGPKYPKAILILFILLHVFANSAMLYYVKVMMQL